MPPFPFNPRCPCPVPRCLNQGGFMWLPTTGRACFTYLAQRTFAVIKLRQAASKPKQQIVRSPTEGHSWQHAGPSTPRQVQGTVHTAANHKLSEVTVTIFDISAIALKGTNYHVDPVMTGRMACRSDWAAYGGSRVVAPPSSNGAWFRSLPVLEIINLQTSVAVACRVCRHDLGSLTWGRTCHTRCASSQSSL